jgi:SAM-dependent methyltransferase
LVSTTSDLRGVFQNNKIHESWEAVYRRGRSQQRFNERLLARILGQLALPVGSSVLDAGCGTGEHTLRLAGFGFQCVGVDLSRPVLQKAKERARFEGLTARVSFHCNDLAELPFADASFDAVHCRGVVMHIPHWERVIAELCRVLRPGGGLVLVEANDSALASWLVRLVRLVRKGESRMVRTLGGLEFWVTREGEAPLTRVANIRCLTQALLKHGICVKARLATEFFDLNRFPKGLARGAAVLFNRLWFRLGLPAWLSFGNALIGEKATSAPRSRE